MEKTKVLIVEDDEFVANQMRWALAANHEVFLAEDRASGIEILKRENPSVVTLDLGLPPHSNDTTEGFLALGEMIQHDPALKVMVITGQDEQENALNAIGQGAFDFFCKPVDIEALKTVIGRAVRVRQYEILNRERQDTHAGSFHGILGECPRMKSVFGDIRKVATADVPVLVSGESGTGKELVARAIHDLSARKGRPFVPINCGAIPETLLESELFGHEKGAFTGAHIQREGRLETANHGTLFLDEIGEIPLTIQVKLLRFIQERTIERVGGRRSISVDARILCATNVDLQKAMAEGKFREDLYYRIGVVHIAMPPLRERNGDMRLIAESLLQRMNAEYRKTLTISKKAMSMMESYPWPGNVRELENRLKRAVIMVESGQITPADLALDGANTRYEGMGLNEAREAIEKDLIERAIARNRGNLSRCADELQIARSSLYELIDKLGISRK